MKDLSPLNRHYLLTFPVVAIILIISFFIGIDFYWSSFICLGFLWPWTLLTPELKEKVRSPRYKFSFFRLIFWIEKQIWEQLFFETKWSLRFVSRLGGPLLFSFILSLVGRFEVFLACLIGMGIAEAWLYFNRTYYPHAFEKRESSLPENS